MKKKIFIYILLTKESKSIRNKTSFYYQKGNELDIIWPTISQKHCNTFSVKAIDYLLLM